jgi:hypothetical protein
MIEQHTAEELERRREEFVVRAKAAFDQRFGQDGKNGLVTFTDREDRACEATDALARWLLEEHLAWDEAKELRVGLEEECRRLGQPPPQASESDPRQILSLTLEYIESNEPRMDYAGFRREGLPISSAAVESWIKQFNQRVKGTEKFWKQGGAECVLQIRVAHLSEDDRSERLHEQRPRGRAVGRNRKKLVA